MRVNTKRIQIKTCIFAGLFVLALMINGASLVHAQSPRDFSNRIERLENEIDTLNRAVYRGETPPSVSVIGNDLTPHAKADIEVRLQQFENEIRSLRGTVEEQGNRVYQMELKLERALSDMQLRISDLENGGTGAHGSVSTFSQSPAEMENMDTSAQSGMTFDSQLSTTGESSSKTIPQRTISLSDDQAAIDYENAFAQLKAGLFEPASQQFMTFLQKYPDHVLAGNAKYWLGETFYVSGDYERAARIFAEGYKEYPQSSKTADNLLKLALSLAAMDNKTDACIALSQLQNDFSASPSPVTQRGAEEAKRLGCSS